jgi:hypothetical protein
MNGLLWMTPLFQHQVNERAPLDDALVPTPSVPPRPTPDPQDSPDFLMRSHCQVGSARPSRLLSSRRAESHTASPSHTVCRVLRTHPPATPPQHMLHLSAAPAPSCQAILLNSALLAENGRPLLEAKVAEEVRRGSLQAASSARAHACASCALPAIATGSAQQPKRTLAILFIDVRALPRPPRSLAVPLVAKFLVKNPMRLSAEEKAHLLVEYPGEAALLPPP